jgi:coenzyme F420-reducing hydrogenase delta subunit
MPVKQDGYQPKIVAFCCNWCSYAGADLAGTSRLQYPASVRIIRVPCSGRVNPQFILRAFQRGADGVLVAGCHPGDCHYSTGNYYARRRFLLATRFVTYLGIEPERLWVRWISGSEGHKFASVIADMTRTLQELGPNTKLREGAL